MITKMKEWVKSFPFYNEVRSRYNEPHRHYHNWNHVERLFDLLEDFDDDIFIPSFTFKKELALSILFHDSVYDPKRSDNEVESVKLFYEMTNCLDLGVDRNKIENLILSTSNPSLNYDKSFLVRLDVHDLKDYDKAVQNEKLIFKEYEFVDWSLYKKKRLEILRNIPWINKYYISYLENQERNIAIYAGSFDPFHKGHLNIFEKACSVFDKVILACGKNPSKLERSFEFPFDYFKYRQVEFYDGLLTDYVESKDYPVTLVRGLRNTSDLQYELTQSRYLQMLKPDIKIVNIFCDNTLEHISSSALKNLIGYGKGMEYIVK